MIEMNETADFQESTKKNKENKIYEFDDLLRLTGGFGRYQVTLYTFLCLIAIPTGAQLLIQVFYGASPLFSCDETCHPGKCCPSCQKYDFQGPFTSTTVALSLRYIIYNE